MKAFTAVCLLAALAAPALAQIAPAPSAVTDTDVLNFALQLEYLEAEFYSCAATGSPLPASLRGGGPASIGCQQANLSATAQAYANELMSNEVAHVTLLRTALGSAAVPIPQINIGSAFSAAADAAFGGATLSPAFSPYLNDLFFYHGAFIFEDVGVTAYLGGASLLTNPSDLLYAAKILAVEAYHGGLIRTLLFQDRDVVTPYNVTVETIVDNISALRAMVGGGSDVGIVAANGDSSQIAPVDANALAFARTVPQVLAIVTLGAGASGGGFFPNGLNGAFGPSSATTTAGK